MSTKRSLVLILTGLAVIAVAAIATLTLPVWSPAAVSLASPVMGKPPGVPERAEAGFAWGDKVYWQWCDADVPGTAIEWRYWNDVSRNVLTGPATLCAGAHLTSGDGLLAEFILPQFGSPFEVNVRRAAGPSEACEPPSSDALRALAAALREVGGAPPHAEDASGWNAAADMVGAAGDNPALVVRDHLTKLRSGLVDCGRIDRSPAATPLQQVQP